MADVSTESPKFVLRDLPGVAELEAGLNLPNAEWAPENDDIQERGRAVARALFGVCDLDLEFDPPTDDETPEKARERYDWEGMFEAVYCSEEEARPFWEFLGWDVTDGKGHELRSLADERVSLGIPIIAAMRQLRGAHLPGAAPPTREKTPQEQARDIAAWTEKMEAEARKFRPKR